MIDTLLAILYWFARPSIAAWAGAVATLVAMFLSDIRRHVRRPFRFVKRAPRVIIIWLIVAWCLSQLAGPGQGGLGKGGGKGDYQGPGSYPAAVGGNSSLVVRVLFVASDLQSDQARDFACIVRIERESGSAEERRLQGKDLFDFEQQLALTLKNIGERPGKMVIERRPYPGEGTVRRIRQVVQQVWPDQVLEEVSP